jgi:hypothetical protein
MHCKPTPLLLACLLACLLASKQKSNARVVRVRENGDGGAAMGAMCWWRSWCLRASGRAERGYLVARLIFLIGTLSAHWSTARLSNPQGHWQPATWPWVLGVGVLSLTRRASPAALARGGPSTTNSFFLSNLLRHFGSSSHYGPRSRGCDFHQSDCEKPRIRLASRSFTL